jgi:hypothetical protein
MFAMKRLLVLVVVLGVAGVMVYAVRARRSSSEPESAPAMPVREAGSATA